MADIEVPHPGASDIVARLLSDALSEHPDVQWLGLVSEDGFAIASEGTESVDDDTVAAGAVRMMMQVRTMAQALRQPGTSQMFMEGGASGICVIDKYPWVLVVMGAPGVPIGLLRYEAREIADAFPMGSRAALPAAPPLTYGQDAEAADSDWAHAPSPFGGDDEEPGATDQDDYGFGTAVADVDAVEFDTQVADVDAVEFGAPAADVDAVEFGAQVADDTVVTGPDGEPEIRWADEPTSGVVALEDVPPAKVDIFGDAGLETVEELEMPSAGADDFSDWLTPAPAATDSMFDLAPPSGDAPMSFEMPSGPEPTDFDLPAPGTGSFDLPAPVAAGFAMGMDDLSDLAPPGGPAIDLPPPAGPAFELPPPE